MSVNLKESSRADAVGGMVCPVVEFSGARRSDLFRLGHPGRWLCLEHHNAEDFRQRAPRRVRPFSNRTDQSSRFIVSLDQDLSVVCIPEELNLLNSVEHQTISPHLPEGRNRAINQRRTYGTLLHWKQFVGV